MMDLTPAALKVEGQQRSLRSVPSEAQDAFDAIILAIRPGQTVHINGLRGLLDLAGVPARARGGLFAGAVSRGLLAPLLTPEGDEIRRKSDGASAHHATCRLYVRTRAMSLKSKPYFWVECDRVGCEEKSPDDEFSAWEDHGQAIDYTQNSDWTVTLAGEFYCQEHGTGDDEDAPDLSGLAEFGGAS